MLSGSQFQDLFPTWRPAGKWGKAGEIPPWQDHSLPEELPRPSASRKLLKGDQVAFRLRPPAPWRRGQQHFVFETEQKQSGPTHRSPSPLRTLPGAAAAPAGPPSPPPGPLPQAGGPASGAGRSRGGGVRWGSLTSFWKVGWSWTALWPRCGYSHVGAGFLLAACGWFQATAANFNRGTVAEAEPGCDSGLRHAPPPGRRRRRGRTFSRAWDPCGQGGQVATHSSSGGLCGFRPSFTCFQVEQKLFFFAQNLILVRKPNYWFLFFLFISVQSLRTSLQSG